MRLLAILFALLAFARPLAAQPAEPPIVAEARAFMADYAEALRRGDRAGIAARYDPDGAWVLGDGRSEFETAARIASVYASDAWQPPAAFDWVDLGYEPAGPDAVVVLGRFAWTPRAGAAPMIFSYTALLRRRDGRLRIRLENESGAAR